MMMRVPKDGSSSGGGVLWQQVRSCLFLAMVLAVGQIATAQTSELEPALRSAVMCDQTWSTCAALTKDISTSDGLTQVRAC